TDGGNGWAPRTTGTESGEALGRSATSTVPATLEVHRACVKVRRLTTQLSDGAPAFKHAGAPALVCALGSAARGRALYVSRRSLQRRVRRHWPDQSHCTSSSLAQ